MNTSRYWLWQVNGLVLLATISLAVGLCTGCASTSPLSPVTSVACVFSIMERGGDRVVVTERVRIVATVEHNADELMVIFRDRADQRPVNFPKARILRGGEMRVVAGRAARCPQ